MCCRMLRLLEASLPISALQSASPLLNGGLLRLSSPMASIRLTSLLSLSFSSLLSSSVTGFFFFSLQRISLSYSSYTVYSLLFSPPTLFSSFPTIYLRTICFVVYICLIKQIPLKEIMEVVILYICYLLVSKMIYGVLRINLIVIFW